MYNSCQNVFTVAFEKVCSLAYETSSRINMRYFGMFITAVCFILLLVKMLNTSLGGGRSGECYGVLRAQAILTKVTGMKERVTCLLVGARPLFIFNEVAAGGAGQEEGRMFLGSCL